VFCDASDPYDRVWHHKVPFMEVANGDFLALDLSQDRHGRVVYLSYDDGEGHGRAMARLVRGLAHPMDPLAGPEAEDRHWLPFCTGPDAGIDPSSAAPRE
jgi:hypothetical protein